MRRHSTRSSAFLQAEWIRMLADWTSASILLSQVVRGRPQWLGDQGDAPVTRRWSYVSNLIVPENAEPSSVEWGKKLERVASSLPDSCCMKKFRHCHLM